MGGPLPLPKALLFSHWQAPCPKGGWGRVVDALCLQKRASPWKWRWLIQPPIAFAGLIGVFNPAFAKRASLWAFLPGIASQPHRCILMKANQWKWRTALLQPFQSKEMKAKQTHGALDRVTPSAHPDTQRKRRSSQRFKFAFHPSGTSRRCMQQGVPGGLLFPPGMD